MDLENDVLKYLVAEIDLIKTFTNQFLKYQNRKKH